MEKKLTSYQKMKQKYEKEIAQLTGDIITLVEDKDFMKTAVVKNRWKQAIEQERVLWLGKVVSAKSKQEVDGLLKQIQK